MEELILSILVHNSSGVLTRVSGLFARRGYNIDSLTVGPTSTEGVSRMTVVAQGDQQILEQIEKQLRKLEDVIEIFALPRVSSVYRELLMVKVEADQSTRADIVSIVDKLDEKYLIAEILKKPRNFKNKAYYYALKKSCKSMNDKIVELESGLKEYRDYIESFVHEIKTPISAISLSCDNKQDKI